MRVAHIILTYTNPQLTERLIKRLTHKNFDFYIHVDKKFSITPYLYLQEYPNVYLIKNREDVRWAGYNTIKATFKCVKEVALSGKTYDYLNFISGQDYPIKPAEYIIDFLDRNNGKQFLEYQSFEEEWHEAIPRITKYHFTNYKFKGQYFLERWINRVLPIRRIPNELKPYGKSMFWMLQPEKAMYVVNYVESNLHLKRFFNFTWGSDEFVFQTILMNSPYKDLLVNNDYRYIDWSAGGSHPKILGLEDVEKLKASDDLFARKFNVNTDKHLLDILDTF